MNINETTTLLFLCITVPIMIFFFRRTIHMTSSPKFDNPIKWIPPLAAGNIQVKEESRDFNVGPSAKLMVNDNHGLS